MPEPNAALSSENLGYLTGAPSLARPRILISEINAADSVILPYVSSILHSYWTRHGSAPDAFDWSEPLWLRSDAEADLDICLTETPDIVGLSCYTWNWELQVKVADWAKSLNPNCLVVAGGPDPDYKDPDFFKKYPSIDMVVVKDGEIPFTQILEAYLTGGRSFGHIPGLYLPSPVPRLRLLGDPASAHIFTGPTQVPTEFPYSPYLDHADMYDRMMLRAGKRLTMAILETNRGCPYSCSYCDWGSATMQKIRKFDMGRVEAEIDWMGKIGITTMMLADANFGIFPRDVDIAKMLATTRAKYKRPYGMYYSSAKNNPERTVEIAKITYDAGLTDDHVLAIQHTDEDVLAGTARSNIAPARYRQVRAELNKLGIPSEIQLILGIPGDTLEKWKTCLSEVMEWGVHDNFQVSTYTLLPNAPAADPAFQAKWKMRTVDRRFVPYNGSRVKDGESFNKSRICVGWDGFDSKDWVEMITYSGFIRALHNRSVTRLPAIYLHYVHGVSYRHYYDAVIDEFCRQSPLMGPMYNRIRAVYENILVDPEGTDAMEVDDFPDCGVTFEPSKWLYATLGLRLDQFYTEFSRYLLKKFPHAKGLKSCIDYQQQLCVVPEYDAAKGKTFRLDRDWPAFFETVRTQADFSVLPEPQSFLLSRTAELAPEDRLGRILAHDFGKATGEERRLAWLHQVARRRHMANVSNHADPKFKAPKSFFGLTPALAGRN